MKKFIPLLIFTIIILAFFKPFFINKLLPIPTDTIVGLYYPFRDLYAATNPHGLPFHNFLITDPVRQQYPWRNLVIEGEKMMQLPLWNPYSFAGTPLAANFQSAAFYPMNILFFILPFATAWSLLVMLQPLLGGIFLYLYLRNLKLHPLSCLLGSIAFVFSGFSVAWLEWNIVLQTVIWLPLILLAKDKLLEKWSIKWTIIFLFAEISAFFGGHLQVLFYALCISNAYLFAQIFRKTQQLHLETGLKPVSTFIKKYIPFLIAGLVMFAITAIQWIPSLQFINLSARNIDQNWHQAGWFIPWQNMLQFLTPDFFGNPATGNYWGVWNYAEFVGYVGIVPLITAIFALFFRHDRKTIFWGSFFFLSLLFAFPTFLAKLPFQWQIPFLATAQPTRLLFVTDFALAILAALGLDYFIRTKSRTILYPLGFLLVIFIGIWGMIFTNGRFHFITPENIAITKHNIVLPTIFFSIIVIGFVAFFLITRFWTSQNDKKTFIKKFPLILTSFFLILTVFDLFRFAGKFETFASSQYLYPDTKILSYLQQHAGNSRILSTDDRLLPPNFSAMYHLQTVDGYDPLYLLQYGELIAALEREKPDISAPFGFNRIITPKNYDSKIMNLLGVKYVLSLSDIHNTHITKIMQVGQTSLYENQQAFPRAIFVYMIKTVATKQEAINTLFDPTFAPATTAVVTCDSCTFPSLADTAGEVPSITQYTANTVTIQATLSHPAFLVLFDQYYPTWHVRIDGKETKIYKTNYAFRGVIVPSGKHTVVFYDKLF